MNWDLCKVFLVVSETGDFSGAARQMRSSHPTVGRKIAALEESLGARLFIRTSGGLALTPEGERFKQHVQTMASAALAAEKAVRVRGENARGVVKLSIGPTLAAHWLMRHLPWFISTHPKIELVLVTHPFPASVMRREADIVLRVFEIGDENLVGRKIARLGTGFYASKSYVSRQGLPERREDWASHHVVSFVDRTSNSELGRWSDRIAKQAAVTLRCSSQSDMLAAVRAGIGICAMSCCVGDTYADLVRVAPHRLAGVSDIWLLAHPNLTEMPAVREVMDFVVECARADKAFLLGARSQHAIS